jgi:Domain of unknown function (DUF4282)
MTERSSDQGRGGSGGQGGQGGQGGRPGDWGSGHAAREQYYGAGSADAYGAGGPAGSYGTGGGRAAGGYGAGPAGSYGAGQAGAYGAGTPDPFATNPAGGYGAGSAGAYGAGSADAYGAGSADPYGAGNADAYGAGMADAGMGRSGAEPPTAGVRHQTAGSKGFLSSLFDFGFTSFVTPTVIKVLYVLIMIGTVLSALAFTIAAFKANAIFGIGVLVIGDPLFIIIVMAFYRIILEFFVVIFRVAEDIRAIRERGGGLG